IEAVDQGVGRRHRRAAVRNFVQHSLLGVAQSEQFGRLGGLRLGQFHLPEQCAGDQHRRHAADLLADVLPGAALLALDVEDFFGDVGTSHVGLPSLALSQFESYSAPFRGGSAHRLLPMYASDSLPWQTRDRMRRGRNYNQQPKGLVDSGLAVLDSAPEWPSPRI